MSRAYNWFLTNSLLPTGDFINGSQYSKLLKKIDYELKIEDIIGAQQLNLQRLLKHATIKSNYYNSVINFDKKDFFNFELKDFPILTKEIIRQNRLEILTTNERLIRYFTSGSTGVQTEILVSKFEQSLFRAIQTTWWNWAGYNIGEPIFQTGLATSRSIEKKLKDFFFRTYYQFAFGLNEQNTEEGLTWAKSNSPFLGGYASSLYVLAELAENKGIQMKSAVTWGDKLFEHYKTKITSSFNCRVFETYGTGEGLMLGAQKDLEYLYIMDPYFIVEILDDNNQEVPDGEIGHVVVTSLIHYAMPLIRYKVGDLAIKLPREEYPERRELNLSLFKKIIGRETDIVNTPNGSKLIVHSFTGVFEYFPEIKQFQVIQKKNETSLIIKFIPGDSFENNVLQKVHDQLNGLASQQLEIEFIQVELIPSAKSGKPQIVVIEN